MEKFFNEAEVIITFKTGTKLRIMTTDDNFVSEYKEEGFSFALKDCETDDWYFISKAPVLYIEVIRYK